jgi:hypothetical protein
MLKSVEKVKNTYAWNSYWSITAGFYSACPRCRSGSGKMMRIDPIRIHNTALNEGFLLLRYPSQRYLDHGLHLVDKHFRGHTVNSPIDLVTLSPKDKEQIFYLETRACSRLQGLTICPAQHKYLEMSQIWMKRQNKKAKWKFGRAGCFH